MLPLYSYETYLNQSENPVFMAQPKQLSLVQKVAIGGLAGIAVIAAAPMVKNAYENLKQHVEHGTSYAIVQPGDTLWDLYAQEGWSRTEIKEFGVVGHRDLHEGDIVSIPQKLSDIDPRGEKLNMSGRKLYATREVAEQNNPYE